jgi:hypothetical protein
MLDFLLMLFLLPKILIGRRKSISQNKNMGLPSLNFSLNKSEPIPPNKLPNIPKTTTI